MLTCKVRLLMGIQIFIFQFAFQMAILVLYLTFTYYCYTISCMKSYCSITLLLCLATITNATVKDSTIIYQLPDSVKAVQFMAEISIGDFTGKQKFCKAGIKTNVVSLYIDNYYKRQAVTFAVSGGAKREVQGIDVYEDLKYNFFTFRYNWKVNENYKLLIAQAVDSAENFSLYSGYIFLPRENKWKLIGTYKIQGRWHSIQNPASFFGSGKKYNNNISIGQVWCQRNTGSWKNMKTETQPAPVVNLFGHIDSVRQRQIDIKLIEAAIINGKTDVKENVEGVYYSILKEGTGKAIIVTDTVVAYYKGYLFSDGLVFDQTKDKPATFPLNRLIKGWQVGLTSSCKVGGKIKLVIPSDLAYSVRTRAAKIPPNSILVFEIEVVDVKSQR